MASRDPDHQQARLVGIAVAPIGLIDFVSDVAVVVGMEIPPDPHADSTGLPVRAVQKDREPIITGSPRRCPAPSG